MKNIVDTYRILLHVYHDIIVSLKIIDIEPSLKPLSDNIQEQ